MIGVLRFLLFLLPQKSVVRTPARKRRRSERGVTLLELMVTITIIGLVAGIVVVAVLPRLAEARIETTKNSISSIQQTLKLYNARHSKYPTTIQGLDILVAEHLLERTPRDAWGNEFVYIFEDGKTTVISYGADGQSGGEGEASDINSNTMNQGPTP